MFFRLRIDTLYTWTKYDLAVWHTVFLLQLRLYFLLFVSELLLPLLPAALLHQAVLQVHPVLLQVVHHPAPVLSVLHFVTSKEILPAVIIITTGSHVHSILIVIV